MNTAELILVNLGMNMKYFKYYIEFLQNLHLILIMNYIIGNGSFPVSSKNPYYILLLEQ